MTRIPVVLIPGLSADERLWKPVADELAELVGPVAAPMTGDSIEAIADDILAVAPERFYLAGTSFGGYVALEVALRGTGRLAGLILVNTSARAASPAQVERGKAILDEVRDGAFDAVVDKLARGVAGGNPELAEIAAAMTRDGGPDTLVRQQTAALARLDRRAELPALDLPTLVLAADDDHLAPPSVNNEIARLVPGAEFEILPAAGHLSLVEKPVEVAEAIHRWLRAREPAADRTPAAVAAS